MTVGISKRVQRTRPYQRVALVWGVVCGVLLPLHLLVLLPGASTLTLPLPLYGLIPGIAAGLAAAAVAAPFLRCGRSWTTWQVGWVAAALVAAFAAVATGLLLLFAGSIIGDLSDGRDPSAIELADAASIYLVLLLPPAPFAIIEALVLSTALLTELRRWRSQWCPDDEP